MALTCSAQQALWIYNFLTKVNLPQSFPVTICANNRSSIALAESTKGHARAKHIDIRHHYICKQLQEGQIKIIPIPTTENIADLFTKSLPRASHKYLINLMGLGNKHSQDVRGSVGV